MMKKEDGSKCQSNEENAEVFHKHFEKLYNRTPTFDPSVIDLLEQHPLAITGGRVLADGKIQKTIKSLKNKVNLNVKKWPWESLNNDHSVREKT